MEATAAAAATKKARAPRKKKIDGAAVPAGTAAVPAVPAPSALQVEASHATVMPALRRKPYSCAECERIYQQEGKSGFCASSCQACGMPVYFRKLADVREYNRNRAGRCPVCGHVGTCVCVV